MLLPTVPRGTDIPYYLYYLQIYHDSPSPDTIPRRIRGKIRTPPRLGSEDSGCQDQEAILCEQAGVGIFEIKISWPATRSEATVAYVHTSGSGIVPKRQSSSFAMLGYDDLAWLSCVSHSPHAGNSGTVTTERSARSEIRIEPGAFPPEPARM